MNLKLLLACMLLSGIACGYMTHLYYSEKIAQDKAELAEAVLEAQTKATHISTAIDKSRVADQLKLNESKLITMEKVYEYEMVNNGMCIDSEWVSIYNRSTVP